MRFSILLALIILFHFRLFSQDSREGNEHFIMFYNVENLFDTEDDPDTNDDEFTPNGDRHWTMLKLDRKIENLAKVIIAAGSWEKPDVIGLCEIENLNLLEKITSHPLLKKLNYQIIHKESPDHRGIDVAMLYRKDLFYPESYTAIQIKNEEDEIIKTREILHVMGSFKDGKRIHFFINHWPSRYGGLMETESTRKLVASCLKKETDEIFDHEKDARIVCMGDFNDQPGDESISVVLGALNPTEANENSRLVNMSWKWESKSGGTIKFQQEWSVFDQFIVSGNLIKTSDVNIFSPDFLLKDDRKYTGVKPFRTYNGFHYNGGFSDHLPIILRLRTQ